MTSLRPERNFLVNAMIHQTVLSVHSLSLCIAGGGGGEPLSMQIEPIVMWLYMSNTIFYADLHQKGLRLG